VEQAHNQGGRYGKRAAELDGAVRVRLKARGNSVPFSCIGALIVGQGRVLAGRIELRDN